MTAVPTQTTETSQGHSDGGTVMYLRCFPFTFHSTTSRNLRVSKHNCQTEYFNKDFNKSSKLFLLFPFIQLRALPGLDTNQSRFYQTNPHGRFGSNISVLSKYITGTCYLKLKCALIKRINPYFIVLSYMTKIQHQEKQQCITREEYSSK